ncbi:MAG: zinc-dependent metalloprotease [Actinomycetia bacterium]|nr:zinc-dependent metalloprotease [Actinomycetes bacterium]
MSDREPPPEPTGPDDDGTDPLAALFRRLGLSRPDGSIDLSSLMAQVQGMMTHLPQDPAPNGIDWAQTRTLARQVVASLGPDPSMMPSDQRAVADAARLAQMWLDPATALSGPAPHAVAWSRAEWIEHSMDNWRAVAEPIATRIAEAMSSLMHPPADEPDDGAPLAALSGMFAPMAKRAAAVMYAQRLAQAIGKLASQVLSGNDSGLPLVDPPVVALLPTNIAGFGEGLGLGADDVLLYLTLREAARQRLSAAAPWLATQTLALVEHYAREITIDPSALSSAVDLGDLESLTPQRMAEASEALQGRLFAPTRTPEQEDILARLETLLALTDGWVETVVAAAAAPWMGGAGALAETLRRRRAAGGPAETLLSSMVGLEVRPRRLRDAVNLWSAMGSQCGLEARDALWRHPDILPTSADLDDIIGFVQRQQAPAGAGDEMDAELRRLLDEWDRPNDGSVS